MLALQLVRTLLAPVKLEANNLELAITTLAPSTAPNFSYWSYTFTTSWCLVYSLVFVLFSHYPMKQKCLCCLRSDKERKRGSPVCTDTKDTDTHPKSYGPPNLCVYGQ